MALSSGEQQTLTDWAEEKGWPTPDMMPTTNEPMTAMTDESPSDSAFSGTRKQREEKCERPKTWLFREYRLAAAKDGSAIIEEDRKRWNDGRSQYDEQDIPTAIAIPEKIREKIGRDSSAADELLAFCNDMRRTLDAAGVKVFIDRPTRSPGKIYAKWKYVIDGVKFQDKIKLDDLPEEIVDLVRDTLEYYKDETWSAWFGPAMQQKREAVISAELGKRYAEDAETVTIAVHAETKRTEAVETTAILRRESGD